MKKLDNIKKILFFHVYLYVLLFMVSIILSCSGSNISIESDILQDQENDAKEISIFIEVEHMCKLDNDCDDNDACTTDTCTKGVCFNFAIPDCKKCSVNSDCTDSNSCTDDLCSSGVCKHEPLPDCVSCLIDYDCNDNDPCTDDSCQANEICLNQPIENCKGCKNNNDCDDDNDCTKDMCSEKGFCVYKCTCNSSCTKDDDCSELNDMCHENARCQISKGKDECVESTCKVDEKDCNDNDPCTLDFCSPLDGVCTHEGIGGCKKCSSDQECDDGNDCTTDSCDINSGGVCSYVVITCEDNDLCTDDFCQPGTGCVHQPKACPENGPCSMGTCDSETGKCSYDTMECDDGNPCTDDLCDFENKKCIHKNNENECDDKNDCTENDYCLDGECHAGQLVVCPEDGNICTDEVCKNGEGCISVNNEAPCSDNNACTSGDFCSDGECQAGEEIDCDDNNVCTNDFCYPDIGCTYTFNPGIDCKNNDMCTENDKCNDQGTCVAGNSVNCDDGVKCTVDTCDKNIGCVWKIDSACLCKDDKDCDDHNPETKDKCVWQFALNFLGCKNKSK